MDHFNTIPFPDIVFKSLIESLNSSMAMLDPEGLILYLTPYMQKRTLSVFQKELKIGGYITDAVPEYLKEKFLETLEKATSGETIKNERQIVLNADKTLWFSTSYIPIRNAKGAIECVAFTVEEITEQKQSEIKVRRNEQMLKGITHNIREGIYRSNTKGVIYVNQSFADMFGYASIEEVLKTPSPIFYANPIQREELLKVLLEKGEYLDVEVVFRRKDGSTFVGLLNSMVSRDEGDEIYFDGSIRDITKEKKYKAEIESKNEELKRLNEALDQFVYSASHDIRAPLASAIGLIELMKYEEKNAQMTEYTHLMEKSLKRLDSFIRDMIDYSRNTRLEVFREEVNLREIIDQVIETQAYSEHAEKIEKIVEVEQSVVFFSDTRRLYIILNNLISNAIRYHNPYAEQPILKIIARVDSKKAHILVSDNGIGIADEHLEKVFNMFYRANSTKVGSGLGLYIVKETVQKLGGSIKVTSQLGEGTTFVIEIENLE
ncbi:MAG: PAS domain-containing sensor histidine kinase [Cytophagales bacterium]|nr:MAG: PAS domain-containing sensor histidine kinase [Cytophagales bacterium]